MTSCMLSSVDRRAGSHQTATRPLHQQIVQLRLHLRQLGGHVLSQAAVVTQLLRADSADNLLGLLDQLIELCVGPDVQGPEPLEECAKVADRRVAEDSPLAILVATQPFT